MKASHGWLIAAAIAVLALVAAVAFAQGGMGRRGAHAGTYGMQGGMHSTVPGLHDHPLSTEQMNRIGRIRQNTQMGVRSIRRNPDLSSSERERMMMEARQRGHNEVMDVLTPEQRGEFHEWWMSRPGMGAGRGMGPGHMGEGRSGMGMGARDSDDPSETGKSIFQAQCASCHGPEGKAMPDWRSKVQKMSLAQVEERVRKGGGGMPAFADTLSKKEIELVARYAKKLAASGS